MICRKLCPKSVSLGQKTGTTVFFLAALIFSPCALLAEKVLYSSPASTQPASSEITKIVLLPTAYTRRGGPNLDMDFTYYIGRLYGWHEKDFANPKTYLDRVGVWLLSIDLKDTFQKETNGSFVSSSFGLMLSYLFPESPASASQTFTIGREALTMYNPYFVLSKKFGGVAFHSGFVFGKMGRIFTYLTEFLPSGNYDGNLFYGGFSVLSRKVPFRIEFMKPKGAPDNCWLIHTHTGKVLHTNFEIAYLHYNTGYDFLGFFNIHITILSAL
ncbi:MAG: hypothetical protein J7L54_05690 [Elusimicrobia bacterium]|nr:hypothetical protein [Elusimicrobiota bacterium]